MSDENQKEPIVDSKPAEELSPEELNKVNGGTILKDIVDQAVGGTTVGPRDPAQGLPTGKRM
jgi:hypothetical protein